MRLCGCRQLCVLLNSKDIYLTLAQILLVEENLKFASIMVETLNTILLTSSELFELRSQLKDLKNEVVKFHRLPRLTEESLCEVSELYLEICIGIFLESCQNLYL